MCTTLACSRSTLYCADRSRSLLYNPPTSHPQGLEHMHSFPTPVVHRDVKAGNIMIVNNGGGGRTGGKDRRLWREPED